MIIGLDGNEANVNSLVGSGKYALEMLRQFSIVKNHQFIVYLKDQPRTTLPTETDNFKYKVFGPSKMWTQFALPINLTFTKKPDIFFSLGHYGPRFSTIPYAVTIFDLSFIHFPHMFNQKDLYQLTNWSKYSVVNSKHIFAISNSTREDIIKNYNIDPSKITVTYMGYDKQMFIKQSPDKIAHAKAKYKIVGDYIIYVGTLQPRKNVSRLIEAFNTLAKNHKNLKLVIVGKKGWLYDEIFNIVKKLNLQKEVIFTDFVPDSDLPPLISGAKLYVLPSLWEGFGIPVVEAQACGTPVVVSNTSSLPEVANGSAVLVDPTDTTSIANGINKLLIDRAYWQSMVKKGQENVLRFSWEQCAETTIKVLEKINL